MSQQATTVAAWACANARKCNLKAVIERDCKHKNRLICDEDQQHNGNRDQRKPCLRWGYCICSPSGREVHRLRNALVKVLKLRCPPGSPSRELLRGAFLVVKLAWRCEVVASPWLAFAVATASPNVPQGQETPPPSALYGRTSAFTTSRHTARVSKSWNTWSGHRARTHGCARLSSSSTTMTLSN